MKQPTKQTHPLQHSSKLPTETALSPAGEIIPFLLLHAIHINE